MRRLVKIGLEIERLKAKPAADLISFISNSNLTDEDTEYVMRQVCGLYEVAIY